MVVGTVVLAGSVVNGGRAVACGSSMTIGAGEGVEMIFSLLSYPALTHSRGKI